MAESSQKLEQVAIFFEDRIATETAVNGTVVFIQRPKPKEEGGVASVSAADLPDDFTVNTIFANSTQLYRISFGPVDIVVNYDITSLSAEIKAKLNVPILGPVQLAQVTGNLKSGIEAAIGYKAIAEGKVGVRLDDGSVVLYWDLTAFGNALKDEISIFSL